MLKLPSSRPPPILVHMRATYVGTDRRNLTIASVALRYSQVPSPWALSTEEEGIDSRIKNTPKWHIRARTHTHRKREREVRSKTKQKVWQPRCKPQTHAISGHRPVVMETNNKKLLINRLTESYSPVKENVACSTQSSDVSQLHVSYHFLIISWCFHLSTTLLHCLWNIYKTF